MPLHTIFCGSLGQRQFQLDEPRPVDSHKREQNDLGNHQWPAPLGRRGSQHWNCHAPSPDSLMAGTNAGLIVPLMRKANAIAVKFTAIVYFRCFAGGVAPRLRQRRRKSLIS